MSSLMVIMKNLAEMMRILENWHWVMIMDIFKFLEITVFFLRFNLVRI